MRSRIRDETGAALIMAVFLIMVFVGVALVVISNSLHTNDVTNRDRLQENAFHAASAGVDQAMRCLSQLGAAGALASCSQAPSASTILTDQGNQIGQWVSSVTDITPVGAAIRRAKVEVEGYGPTIAAGRKTAKGILAEVDLLPQGGFFETVFAGGSGTPGAGEIAFMNTASVNGSMYARTLNQQMNNGSFGDLRTFGDAVTKNNDTYRSILAGGDVVLGNNTTVQTNAKACGSNGTDPGNATLGNGSVVTLNLQYKGTRSGMGTAGSYTNAPCADPPPALNTPTYDFLSAPTLYPGWTVVQLNGALVATTANACLKLANCAGTALGDSALTYGRSLNGTLVWVKDSAAPNCTVTFGGSGFPPLTVTGNFVLATDCKLTLNGTLVRSGTLTTNKQVAFISTSTAALLSASTSDLDVDVSMNTPATLDVLFFGSGQVTGMNSVTIDAGAVYGGSVEFRNAFTISSTANLAGDILSGFTFDPTLANSFRPLLIAWREKAVL